jgi:hypothetical protein
MATWQEKTWYKWKSIDAYIWSEWTFWYSKNIDIRNDLKWIQLLSDPKKRTVSNKLVCYVKNNINELLRIYENWSVTIWNNLVFSETNIWILWMFPQWATKFRDWIYVFSYSKIKRFQVVAWAMAWLTNITPTDRWTLPFNFFSSWLPVLNFWNSALLVWRWNQLWRWLPSTSTWPVPSWWRKLMRTFDIAEIRWIVWRSSNIEVYVDYNNIDSRIYFIGWFWDAVDTWISNTIILENLSISQIWQIWERTFIVCNNLSNIFKTSLYEISWYNKRLIKESTLNALNSNYHSDFRLSTAYQQFPVSWWMMYLPFYDQVWSYGRESDDIWDNLCWLRDWKVFISWVAMWDFFYWSEANWTSYKEYRYNLTYRHNDYINEPWVLISRIFDWWMMWLRKQLLQIYVWYKIDTTWNPANAWSIDLYLRTDMDSYNITDWRIKVVTIDDTTKMREIIETQQIRFAWIDDFSTIQYKVVINPWSSQSVSPILYELSFFYDDQIKAIS